MHDYSRDILLASSQEQIEIKMALKGAEAKSDLLNGLYVWGWVTALASETPSGLLRPPASGLYTASQLCLAVTAATALYGVLGGDSGRRLIDEGKKCW